MTTQADAPLEVLIEGNRLLISIGLSTLAFAVTHRPDEDNIYRIIDPLAAGREIARQLRDEDEEGTTAVHRMLDKAAWDAWENGGKGFEEQRP